MTKLGTPLSSTATKVLLLGSGELGKEVVIELQRLGCEVIACDRYDHAPAMQVAHRSHVFPMLDGKRLREVIESERPHLIVPEIEAIATDVLVALEREGFTVVPSARAAQLTMNREGIRRLAAEELGLPTSPFRFIATREEFAAAAEALHYPCVIKPVMSSSGKGQSVVRSPEGLDRAWRYSQEGSRAGAGRCIVEGFITFAYEITVLTVSAVNGLQCCPPIGHIQIDGDYRESWQPIAMSAKAWDDAQRIAQRVVSALGGRGIFGVEMFVCGTPGSGDERVIFSEVSPRPHDTGMVTMASQQQSEFELHAKAILGLPVNVALNSPAASAVIYGEHDAKGIAFEGVADALREPGVDIRLFGKPESTARRRMGVALATANDVDTARARAKQAAAKVKPVIVG